MYPTTEFQEFLTVMENKKIAESAGDGAEICQSYLLARGSRCGLVCGSVDQGVLRFGVRVKVGVCDRLLYLTLTFSHVCRLV